MATTGSTKAEALVRKASAASCASATEKGRSSIDRPSRSASAITARRVQPGRIEFELGRVTMASCFVTMKLDEDEPSVTNPRSSTIQAS